MKTTVTILKNRGSIYNIIGTIYKVEAPYKKNEGCIYRNLSTIYENASTIYEKQIGWILAGMAPHTIRAFFFCLDLSGQP